MAEQQNLAPLFAKIAIITGELGAVEKDAKHQQNYMYHSADAVMGALNPLLAKYGIVIIPSASNAQVVTGADGLTRWIIDYQFTVADAESGAYFVANWTSEGIMSVGRDANDKTPKPDDKSMGKAHTYSMKYWLIQLFKISTKDTADLDTNNQDGDKKKQDKPAQKSTPPAAKDPLDPDTHLGAKPEKELHYTEVIKSLEVKLDKNKKEFLSADGITIFTRKPFRDLGYPQEVIDKLGIVGQVFLPEGKFIRIAYSVNGKFKTAEKIHRIDTEETVSALPVKQ